MKMLTQTKLDEDFKQVLADFKKRLNPEERANFEFTTLNGLEMAAQKIQEEQKKSKTVQNLTRIEPFLLAMTQFTETIEVFLNASSFVCFVWGPMKFLLVTACNLERSFDILLETYKQLAENFPLLKQYRSIFQESDHMRNILVWIYEDILKFHLLALRVFTRPLWQKFFNATWKDFQASSKSILNDMTRHRELIERRASLEQIQESRDARFQIQASFDEFQRDQNLSKTIAIVSWLSAADAGLDQEDFAAARHNIPESGRWILEVPKIKDWLDPADSSVPIFWLNGIPGAGKTILASVIIEECLEVAKSEKQEISLAYFYCKEQDSQRNKFLGVAKSILAQLLQQNPDILAYLYDECSRSAKVTLESQQGCIKILGTILQAVPKTFIIVDGIDECEPKERKAMLNFFSSAIKTSEAGKIRGLFVSQDLSDIKTILNNPEVFRLNEEHNKLDIKNYAMKWAFDIQRRFKPMPDAAREHIVRLVCDGSDGMFLFAKLVLENMFGQQNLEDVYQEMDPEIFPRGLEKAYDRIVKRILDTPNQAQNRTAQQLLGWITCAKRPLKWQEIQGAVSIDVKQGVVNFEGRHLPDHIREICGSLVDVLPGHRIQLVHKTVRQHLIRSKLIDEQREELVLAILCLKYLTFECFDATISDHEMQKFLFDGYYAFLDYASLHWNHHLETALPSLKPEDLCHSAELGIAIAEFFEMYVPEMNDLQEDYIRRCEAVQTGDCCESLVLLLSHAKASRLAEEKLEALGPLGVIIARFHAILEELSGSTSSRIPHPVKTQDLRDYYGDNWYKCSRHLCFFFHEGFLNARGLEEHTNRHEKPFCCTEIGCTRMYIGWATEKELKKHMSQYHPDPQAFAWKFPHVKKPPAMFPCKLCTKQFTRANNLNIHTLREHGKDRPVICETCGKGFVRKYDRDRHAMTHSSKSRGNSQLPEVDGNMDSSELI